jgi:hypothetical protein
MKAPPDRQDAAAPPVVSQQGISAAAPQPKRGTEFTGREYAAGAEKRLRVHGYFLNTFKTRKYIACFDLFYQEAVYARPGRRQQRRTR